MVLLRDPETMLEAVAPKYRTPSVHRAGVNVPNGHRPPHYQDLAAYCWTSICRHAIGMLSCPTRDVKFHGN